jgi:hypothetical protein
MHFIPQALSASLVAAASVMPAAAADLKSYPVGGVARINPGVAVSLNPQPLPPGGLADSFAFVGKSNPGAAVSLNPQPLPPGGTGFNSGDSGAFRLKARHPSGVRVDPVESLASKRAR